MSEKIGGVVMGMTASFLFVENRIAGNRAFTRDFLVDAVEEIVGWGRRERFVWEHDSGALKAVIAYREDARWLPVFVEWYCDWNFVESGQLMRFSERFGVPVLGFSVQDSDALFISYFDAANGIGRDYVKTNYDDFEEYDTEVYLPQFPEFLADFCSDGQLAEARKVWDGDFVFAEDRMFELGQLLGMEVFVGSADPADLVVLADDSAEYEIITLPDDGD